MSKMIWGELMEISESETTQHEIICIHYKGADKKLHEKWIDIHKDGQGELMMVSIGSKEITAFDLEIIAFLKKEGKL